MFIFNKFKETIIAKEPVYLEEKLDKLKKVKKQVIDKDKIDKKIILLEKAKELETNIINILKESNIGVFILADVNISYNNTNTRIDFIIITKAYCYLVSCIDMVGSISINNEGEFRREYYVKDKYIKEKFPSSYLEVIHNKEILKKYSRSSLRKNVDEYYKPLLLTNDSNIDLTFAPKSIKDITICTNDLVSKLQADIKSCKSSLYNNKKQLQSLVNYLINANNISSKEAKQMSFLEHELLEFRKDKSKSKNIPTYYIFTNEELENILRSRPNSVDELETVLDKLKTRYYGREIINIIRNHLD